MSTLGDIEERLAQLEERVAKLEATGPVTTPKTNKQVSIKEYLLKKDPKTANDTALVIGYFLENHSGYEQFTADDIKQCFRLAKVPQPKNMNDVVNKNIAKGFMMESGKQLAMKSWVLTASGEAVVEGFGSDK